MDLDMDGIYRVLVLYCHLLRTSTPKCGYNHIQHTYILSEHKFKLHWFYSASLHVTASKIRSSSRFSPTSC